MKCAKCENHVRGPDIFGHYRCFDVNCKIRTFRQIDVGEGRAVLGKLCATHSLFYAYSCPKCKGGK